MQSKSFFTLRSKERQAMATNVQSINGSNSSPEEIAAVVDDMMTFHPWTPEQLEMGAPVRYAAKGFISALLQFVPPSADRSAAIRHVREALYSANGAITHMGKY
jgi:hypothetical protein